MSTYRAIYWPRTQWQWMFHLEVGPKRLTIQVRWSRMGGEMISSTSAIWSLHPLLSPPPCPLPSAGCPLSLSTTQVLLPRHPFFCLVSNLARRNVALKCYVGALSLSLSPRMGEQEGRINIRCGSYFSQSTSTSSSVYSFHIRVIRRQVSVSILWCLFASLTWHSLLRWPFFHTSLPHFHRHFHNGTIHFLRQIKVSSQPLQRPR